VGVEERTAGHEQQCCRHDFHWIYFLACFEKRPDVDLAARGKAWG
jgi:hypothetical protein